MKRFALLAAVLTALPVTAPAADSAPATPSDPILEQASAALQREDWKAAQALLKDGLSRAPGNADYHNLYAYAIRKGPNPDMQLVFRHYGEALKIDPKHRGAHEYIGEAYLMVGDVAKAKEHLARLDKLCFLPCSEYRDLKKAIAEYEARASRR